MRRSYMIYTCVLYVYCVYIFRHNMYQWGVWYVYDMCRSLPQIWWFARITYVSVGGMICVHVCCMCIGLLIYIIYMYIIYIYIPPLIDICVHVCCMCIGLLIYIIYIYIIYIYIPPLIDICVHVCCMCIGLLIYIIYIYIPPHIDMYQWGVWYVYMCVVCVYIYHIWYSQIIYASVGGMLIYIIYDMCRSLPQIWWFAHITYVSVGGMICVHVCCMCIVSTCVRILYMIYIYMIYIYMIYMSRSSYQSTDPSAKHLRPTHMKSKTYTYDLDVRPTHMT